MPGKTVFTPECGNPLSSAVSLSMLVILVDLTGGGHYPEMQKNHAMTNNLMNS